MSLERKQVLEMLAEGKITAEEADSLLDRLEGAARATAGEGPGDDAGGKLRFLRVLVNSNDGDQINVRVPLALVRTGIKLSTMLPREANERLRARGVDLSQLAGLEGEELIEALRELTVNVDSSDGDVVRVFCE